MSSRCAFCARVVCVAPEPFVDSIGTIPSDMRLARAAPSNLAAEAQRLIHQYGLCIKFPGGFLRRPPRRWSYRDGSLQSERSIAYEPASSTSTMLAALRPV